MDNLPTSLTTVTPLSRAIAMALFVALPFVGFFYGMEYQKSVTVQDDGTSYVNEQPTESGERDETSTYTNETYGISFTYPAELEKYMTRISDETVVIGYPGPSLSSLFSLHIFETDLDPEQWWENVGKSDTTPSYAWLINTAINNVSIGENYEIRAKEVVGQRKTPGGATLSDRLLIIPIEGHVIVIDERIDDSVPGADMILSSLRIGGQHETQDEASDTWKQFSHPVAGYSLKYPVNWTGGLQEVPAGLSQEYQDFRIKSPDYQLTDNGYGLVEGAEIFVRVEKSNYTTIGDVLNSDPLASRIAFDRKDTEVDGLDAIQYDYSYEGHRATTTIFLKGDNYYTVKYRYVNDESRRVYWESYMILLSSFSVE